MLKKSKVLFVACILMLALLLGACDGGETQNDATEPTADIVDENEPEVDLQATEEAIDAIATDDANMVATEVAEEDMSATEEAGMIMATEEAEAEMLMQTREAEEAGDVDATAVTTDTETMVDDVVNVAQSNRMIGLDINDETGTKVGEVSEVLFNEPGELQYVVVDISEFLGESEERITAIPWDTFQGNDNEVVMDETQDRFIEFHGDTTDLENATELDTDLSDADLKLSANDLGIPVEFDNLFKLSAFDTFELFNYDLVNLNGDDLGEVESLVVDLTEGQVRYAVADVGGFLGVAETPVALPWDQIEFDEQAEEFVIDADETTLTDAPVPNFDEWDDGFAVDENWDAEVENYWDDQLTN